MSQYERVDLVDENDQVVTTVERTPEWEKTRQGGVTRIVNVFVWTSERKLVVQQRSKKKANGPFLFDSSVGGMVTSGMSYVDAAKKEMAEELGLEGDLTFVTAFKSMSPTTGQLRSHHHLFEHHSDGPYSNWETEAERLEFMTLDELEASIARFPYLFTVGFKDAVRHYKEARLGLGV